MSSRRGRTEEQQHAKIWKLIDKVDRYAESEARRTLRDCDFILYERGRLGLSAVEKLTGIISWLRDTETRFRAGWVILLILRRECFMPQENILYRLLIDVPLLQSCAAANLLRLIEDTPREMEVLRDIYHNVPWQGEIPKVAVFRRLSSLRE